MSTYHEPTDNCADGRHGRCDGRESGIDGGWSYEIVCACSCHQVAKIGTEAGGRTPHDDLERIRFVREHLRQGDEVSLVWNANLGVPRTIANAWVEVTSTARPKGTRIAVRDGAFDRLVSMRAVDRIRRLAREGHP